MRKGTSTGLWIAGVGLGAGCMYFMDPDRGRARRARIHDKAASACRGVRISIDKAQADLANRAHGFMAEAKSVFRRERVDEDQLIARVRAKLGRLVSYPHAIDVFARGRTITLSGAVLEPEAEHLLHAVAAIRGVCSVCDHLVRRREAEAVSERSLT